jgi:nucleotide-binding universal stress UspA family protein
MPDRTLVIVAGVSELTASDPTLLVATEIARAAGAELHLVHAYQLPPLIGLSPGLEAAYPEGLDRYRELLTAALYTAARALPGGEAAKCRVLMGPAALALAEVASEVDADLLVVGAARGSRWGRAILGTTAQRVIRAAHTPVLVARRPVTLPLRHVLLTTDLSEPSASVHATALRTLEGCFGLPERLRSLVVLGWMGVPAPLSPQAVDHAAVRELRAFLRERSGPAAEAAVRTGVTADEIVAEAREWDADLLVVGTHARGWGARLMLGSVAEAALRDAPCNVLAVPPAAVPAAAHAVAEPARVEPWRAPEFPAWLPAGA